MKKKYKMNRLNLICVCVIATAVIFSCKKEDPVDCTGITPTYTSDIAPIMNQQCAFSGCHGGNNPSDGIDLSNYADTKAESTNGKVIASIKHASGTKAMPQGSQKLSDADIRLIECWVQNGAPQ